MPNWVKNKLTIKDSNYANIIEQITSYDKEDDEFNLDFNKIVPMPESVKNTISGSVTKNAISLFLNSIKDKQKFGDYHALCVRSGNDFVSLSNEEFDKMMKMLLEYKDFDFENMSQASNKFQNSKEVLEYGKVALENIKNYGAIDWYDWAIKNWNTKWNACGTKIDNNVVWFDTAWDSVDDLMLKLSKLFPTAEFEYEYVEEQICEYCGEMKLKNGMCIDKHIFEPRSKQAYEKGFEFFPDAKRYFKYDKKLKTYKYNEGELD